MAMVSLGGSERHLPSSVVTQFQSGIKFIDKLMAALQMAKFQTGFQFFDRLIAALQFRYYVRPNVENACDAFSKAERDLESHIRHQTKKCREEEAKLSSMQRKHQEIVKDLAGLTDSLVSLSKILQEQGNKVAHAQQGVYDSEERVRKARSKLRDAIEKQKNTEIAGWATIWIPVVGASLLLASATSQQKCVDNAEHSLDSTKSDLSSAENTLSEMKTEHSNTQDEISMREMEKFDMEEEMDWIQENISTYRNDITEQNRTLTALRKVMTRLGKVSGRAEVLRDATVLMHDVAEIGIPLKSLFDSFEGFITQPDQWRRVLASPVFQAICDDGDDKWC